MIDGWSISSELALRWMSLDLTDEKSTLVPVMVWCHQATGHYLSQCWPRSLSPYGVTRPQWVKWCWWTPLWRADIAYRRDTQPTHRLAWGWMTQGCLPYIAYKCFYNMRLGIISIYLIIKVMVRKYYHYSIPTIRFPRLARPSPYWAIGPGNGMPTQHVFICWVQLCAKIWLSRYISLVSSVT